MTIEKGGANSDKVLTPEISSAIDALEVQVKELMAREGRQEDFFRALITLTELADVGKYITHDPKLNPGARPHGNPQDEVLAHGQLLVMSMGLMVSRGIPFKEALAAGLQNWTDRDWAKARSSNSFEDIEVKGMVACPGVVSGIAYVVSEENRLKNLKGGFWLYHFSDLTTQFT